MKARGLEFLTIPDSYYEQLREKLKSAKITVAEDLNTVSSLETSLLIINFSMTICPHSRSIPSFSVHVLEWNLGMRFLVGRVYITHTLHDIV